MKKLLAIVAALTLSTSAMADYEGGKTIKSIEVYSGNVTVTLNNIVAKSCSYWGASLKFDPRTPGGQVMLSTLLAAKVNNRGVDVWYSPKGVTGNCNNNINGLATLNGVRIK